jgi:primase-polymerase (primpol)-like protein
LAFWTGGDRERIERLFDQSGLVREKWWSRADYRERTIANAVRSTGEFYEPADG